MEEKQFENQFKLFQEKLKQAIENYGINKWSRVVKQINDIVDIRLGSKGNLNAIYKMKDYKIEEKKDFIVPEWAIKFIETKASDWAGADGEPTKTGSFYESMLGFLYEEFIMKEFACEKAKEMADKNIQNIYNSLFKGLFHTGAIQGPQALRAVGPVLYDVMIDTQDGLMNEESFKITKDALLYNKKDINGQTTGADRQVTIKQEITLKYDEKTKNIFKDETNESILNKIKASNLYGFGIKKYDITPGTGVAHKFSSSSVLQHTLNDAFKNTEPKTWNAIYAWGYVQAQVNKHILDIVGPNSVGQFFGNMFLWTSDFVGNTLLTMQVYGKDGFVEREDQGKKFTEIQPRILTSDIYFRYLAGRKVASIIASTKKNKSQTETKVSVYAKYSSD